MFNSYVKLPDGIFFWGWLDGYKLNLYTFMALKSYMAAEVFFSHEKVLDMYQAVGSRKCSLTVIWSYPDLMVLTSFFRRKAVVVSSPIGWNNWKIIPQSPSCRNLASRPPITPSSTPWVRHPLERPGPGLARQGILPSKMGGWKIYVKHESWWLIIFLS